MSIGPILPGRIPSSLVTRRVNENISRTSSLLLNLQDQIASGQKFFLPSDSPAAAIRTIFLQKVLERRDQLETNVATDKSLLNATETVLGSVSEALNQAKAFNLVGVGDTSSPAEKLAMATEVASLVTSVINAANTNFRGRYLFGGSESLQLPFELISGGGIRYNGDKHEIDSFVDNNFLLANNVDGIKAFGAITTPVGDNIDPALTLNNKISDLYGGQGVKLGSITVSVDDGVNPVKSLTVDLSNAETVGDLKTILEDAFAGGPPNLTVEIDPASKNGIRLTPSGGTVAVTDLAGSNVASYLGIASAAAAVINGGDLDPRLTLLTNLSDLNNGAGIGATAGNGLQIVNGLKTGTVDIDSATTVEDLFNLLELSNLDLMVGINDAGNGLAISSRVSGVDFSIGENNGANAAGLGIRTLDGSTLLKDLNLGVGVPNQSTDPGGNLLPALIEITRRDGATTTDVDIKGLNTIQEVIDAINAVDPGVLTASLNAVGNGISIVDTSGTDPLTIVNNEIGMSLGIDGTEPGSTNTVPFIGKDINPLQANGVLNLLAQLQIALQTSNDNELARLDPLFDQEIERFTLVRSELGSELKTIEEVENRLLDREVVLQQTLSDEFDVDLAAAITQLVTVSANLEATMRVAADSFRLSLMNYL